MRNFFNHPLYRSFVGFLVGALVNGAVPEAVAALLPLHSKLPPELRALLQDHKTKQIKSRVLGREEMKRYCGKDTLNPYLAGTTKWDPTYKGVDMFTGNYSLSVTDLDFQGGFGIPVSVQRSYSANQQDEGPFGHGWSLSADVRTTAGGVLKSTKAPVMAVPVTFKEMPAGQADPRLATPPVAGVVATDTSSNDETIQKDVDGVLTTPPWDNNVSNPTYTYTLFQGSYYQIQSGNQTVTPDGTVYTYATEGSYPNGMTPVNNPSGTAVPSNVLKVTSVADRNGNTTLYNYSSTNQATFEKANGTSVENELTSVSMPNGHTLSFTWNQNVQSSGKQRIVSVSDNGSPARVVNYGYNSLGELTSVTTPGGKTTNYGYGGVAQTYSGLTAPSTPLLTSITDPRGLQTQMTYFMDTIYLEPYSAQVAGPLCVSVQAPNGNAMAIYFAGEQMCCYGNFVNLRSGNESGGVQISCIAELEGGLNDATGEYNQLLYAGFPATTGYQTNYSLLPPEGSAYQFPFSSSDFMPAEWVVKTYDPFAEQCLSTQTSVGRGPMGPWRFDQLNNFQDFGQTNTTDVYNFQGNPLSETTTQFRSTDLAGQDVESAYPTSNTTKQYAYWGQGRFFQQKAEVDNIGTSEQRIVYTEYYPVGSAQGTIGNTYKSYSDPYAIWQTNTLPQNDQNWQDDLVPNTTNEDSYSSLTDYDSYGRATDVYKLQTVSGSTYSYVHTNTAYGANNSTWWGEPETVTEDVGGISRVTQTLAYDSSGHATTTEDAAGHIFQTNYANADYQVGSIAETDCSPNVTLVSYAYGTNPGEIDYGQVDSVADGLSGITDSFTYDGTVGDPGLGQVSGTSETGGSNNYSVAYTYTPDGNRGTVTYTTNNGTTEWQYADYGAMGMPQNGGGCAMVPQTMRLLSSGSPTPEEFHYMYDGSGALQAASFAMTPENGFTPQSGQPWYDQSDLPSLRARVVYDNDGGGRNLNLNYYWDTWSQSGQDYNSTGIYGYSYAYDPVSFVKTQATFDDFNPHNEAYGYDPVLQYLTSANYNSGNGGTTESWTYDAAGNRLSDSANPGSWTYDDLNRLTASPGLSYSNDILGDRLSNSATQNGWDQFCRMTSFTSGSATTNYAYRADGMRVSKSSTAQSTTYAYDGQMGFEDVDSGTANVVTDYAIGPRGLDRICKTVNGTATLVYPLYDGHGNMIADLSESGSSYQTNDQRSFDAWGSILNADTGGDPKPRYCGALGHKQDDESGLIYMRARYYDATAGRFISEDPKMQGRNFFEYANNAPTVSVDRTGKDPLAIVGILLAALVGGLLECILNGWSWQNFLRGAVFGATAATAALLGPLVGMLFGALTGGADAAATGGDVGVGALIGGCFGVLSGAAAIALPALEACSTEMAACILMLGVDCGLLGGDAAAYSGL